MRRPPFRLLTSVLCATVASISFAAAVPAAASSGTVVLAVGVDGPGAASALASAGRVVSVNDAIGVVEVEVPAGRAVAAAAALESAPGVGFVERDQPVSLLLTPSDPYWAFQWGARKVDAPDAWDVTTGSAGTVIAILDTGVTTGPEFAGKLLAGIDLVNGDSDAADDHGHGTAAAGVAAAWSNQHGAAGLCWSCAVLPVKVLGADGSGSSTRIAQGITWAADNGAHVINLSLGGSAESRAVTSAIGYARSKGAVVIAAAGNTGTDSRMYPAATDGVISVAGSTSSDGRYSWSNFGSWVDIAAPGCNYAPTLNGGYSNFCGTSSATPVVAGAAGLAVSLGATGTEAEAAILSTGDPIGSWVANGRLNAAAALAALSDAPPQPEPAPQPAPQPEPAPQPQPQPQPEPTPEPVSVTRASGGDRAATSVAIARNAFADGARTVVVARADAYADALAAAPLAAKHAGPVLLSGGDTLDSSVAAVVRELGARTAILVGGTSALGPGVEDGLRAAGVSTISRIAGSNRFDTAAQVAGWVGGRSVYIVEGANVDASRGWPDAVAVSGLAATQRRPILLTTSSALPKETADALSMLGATSAVIVGGTNAVSAGVQSQVAGQVPVTRVAGSTRYDTSARLAGLAVDAGVDRGRIWVATGRSWPDALAAGPAAAASGGILVLVDGTDLANSPQTASVIGPDAGVRTVVVVGGTASVSTSAAAAIEALVR